MTAQMRGLPSQGGASGVAYFDDLCVTFDVKNVEGIHDCAQSIGYTTCHHAYFVWHELLPNMYILC